MSFLKVSRTRIRNDFLNVAQRLTLNKIKIEQEEYTFTCNEIGVRCNLERPRGGMTQPPCCSEIFVGMKMVVAAEMMEKKMNRGCFIGTTAFE